MTVFGMMKITKLILWVVGCAFIGYIATRMMGMVKDKEVPIIFCAIIGLLIGLFMETFSEE